MIIDDCEQIRLFFRGKRQALCASKREEAALALLMHLRDSPIYQQAEHIGCYMALPEEINPTPVLMHAQDNHKQVYLPIVQEDNEMIFARYEKFSDLVLNRFGILEPPANSEKISSAKLDCVFVPLVAFDHFGYRLGMGAGFYDKHFAFLKAQAKATRPLLIGLGFQCQYYPNTLPHRPWDIPLHAVLTEAGFFPVKKKEDLT